jgi:N-acetyltransferase
MQADISKFFAVKKSTEPVNSYLQKISNKNGLKKSNSFDDSVFKFELSPTKKKGTLASKPKSRSFLNEDSDSDSVPKNKGRKRKLETDDEPVKNKKARIDAKQLHLTEDLREICPKCGMPYAAGLAEDEKIHRMHCNKKVVVKPIQFTGWQNQVIVREDKGESSYVVVVDCNDKAYTYKKFTDIKDMVHQEIGWNGEKSSNELWYLYVKPIKKNSEKKFVVACLVMETINQAFPIIFEETPQSSQNTPAEAKQSDGQDKDTNTKASENSVNKKKGKATTKAEAESGSPTKKSQSNGQSSALADSTDFLSQSFDMDSIVCSKDAHEAALGVSRIWVHTDERRKGIATKLIDAARAHHIQKFGRVIPKSLIAFSQPTRDGKHFAVNYFGKKNFLVYG